MALQQNENHNIKAINALIVPLQSKNRNIKFIRYYFFINRS